MKKRTNLVSFLLIASIAFTACTKGELVKNEPGNLVPKTVTEDASLSSISVNGTTLHAETFGNSDSPMVVILHGGPGSDYRCMLKLKTLAEDGYFAVFYDQRGTGLSRRHNKNEYTMQTMLDDLSAVIAHYRRSPKQKIFLLGQSWGAMLATSYVNAYPAAVNGVILSEPGGFTWSQTKEYIKHMRELNPFEEGSNDVFYIDQFLTGKENEQEVLDYKMGIASAYETRQGNILGNAGPYPFWRYGAILQRAMFDLGEKQGFNWTTNLGQYSTKILFCYSEGNKAYGLQWAQQVSAAYPNVQLEKINGSGHEIPWFGFNNFYPLVKTYLKSH